jgi:hypothetical protein
LFISFIGIILAVSFNQNTNKMTHTNTQSFKVYLSTENLSTIIESLELLSNSLSKDNTKKVDIETLLWQLGMIANDIEPMESNLLND